jgi:hypothetical protein
MGRLPFIHAARESSKGTTYVPLLNGDKLKLTSSKTLQFERGGNPIEMSGEWKREKADKK